MLVCALPGQRGPQGLTGATYIRWGRDDCPTTEGTELVYSGLAGGSRFSESGGGSNYLCLPTDPQYLNFTNARSTQRAYVYGAEYEIFDIDAFESVHDHDVPCALCFTSTRATATMIPARIDCPIAWTREYFGYLMAGRFNQDNSPKFECVDVDPETVPNSDNDDNGARFYFAETRCRGICPPYETGRELTCVVCTR